MSLCQGGCGTELAPVHRGKPRQWCSERCRKQTLYGGECEICGARTNGSNGRAAAATRCAEHNPGLSHGRQARTARSAARNAEIRRLWSEGRTLREIAAAVDSTPNSICTTLSQMRAAGVDVPYRYKRTAA